MIKNPPLNRPGVQKKKVRKRTRFYQCSKRNDNHDSRKDYYYRLSHDEQQKKRSQHLSDGFTTDRLPSPDHAWNKSVPAVHESVQPWLSNLAQRQDPRESFDELTDTTFDFSAFVMNRLNVKTLTPKLLAGPTFELLKASDWITGTKRDDDVLYKFKEATSKLRIPNLKDMLLLLRVRKSDKSQRQRNVYQKKLNLTKPDTYRSNLRRRDAYTPYSDPRGFIYENKDKKNRLMRIDELHKFSDANVTKKMSRAMIQAIDKRLKTRRIMRSLERFVEHAEYDESNTYVLERFNTTAGNPVKKILLKLNLSDHRLFKDGDGDFRYSDTTHLSRSVEVLKLKNFKKDATLKLFKNGMSMSVQKSQVHKMAKLQDGEEIMLG
ncbi:hypothetical protein Tco_1393090 [Tanacetum coccineum]